MRTLDGLKEDTLGMILAVAILAVPVFTSTPVFAAPEIPTPIAPLQETDTSQPEFVWLPLPDATSYVLLIADRSTGERVHWQNHLSVDVCGTNQCRVTPDIDLGFSNQHVWYVRSRSEDGASAWAKTFFAYKDALPPVPSPIAPITSSDDLQPEFSWSNESGAHRYVLLIVDRSTGQRVHWKTHYAEDVCIGAVCSYTPDISLGFSNQHIWYVRSWNYTGASAWAKTVFAIQDEPPGIPDQLAPLSGVLTLQPDLQWTNDSTVTNYVVVLKDVTNDNRLLWKSYASSDVCSGAVCTLASPAPLDYSTRYVWYVRAKNTTNASAWAKTFFTTADSTNTAPIANPDSAIVTRGSAVVIDVLANDSDPDDSIVSDVSGNNALSSIDQTSIDLTLLTGAEGSIEIAGGKVVYTHDGSAGDSVAFHYTVADNQGAVSATAVVSIAIEDAPAKHVSASDITDLILITGQSNVRGSQSGYDNTLDTIDLRVFAYTGTDDWEVADLHQAWDVDGWHPGNGSLEPYCLANPECTPRQPYNNFAFHFAKTVVEHDPNRVVGIIVASAPGEGISHWDEGSDFSQSVQAKVLAALNAQGVKSGIDGILWHQGETDWQIEGTSDADASGFEKTYAEYYPEKLNNLIARFRAESWFRTDKPFICGETRQAPVNQRLMDLEADNDPWTGCVQASDLPTMEMDLTASPPQLGTHFDASGLRTLGHRYAVKYLEMSAQ